jgi:Domain of unknown function (DUF5134)
MGWLSSGLAIVCLVVGVLHLVRLVVRRREVAGECSHAAMGLGMATMLSPSDDLVPSPVWPVVYALCAAWFAAVWCYRTLLRSGTLGGDAAHHVIASGAMLFMLATPTAHGAHGAGGAGPLGLVSLVAIVLTGYFAWHVLRCADRCRWPEPAVSGASVVALRAPVRAIETPQLAAAAHLVMAVAMAVMLLGML